LKYWAYFAAKLLAAALCLRAMVDLLGWVLPAPEIYHWNGRTHYAPSITLYAAEFAVFLLGVGLLYVIVLDQRMRCRKCLRLLRMPIEKGSWSRATLFSPPELESICPYGHGTLTEPELQITGLQIPAWTPHDDDIWKELESLDKRG
jgi:hypothetical protein